MVNYPFTNSPLGGSAAPVNYDIVVKFEAVAEGNYGLNVSSQFTSEHSGNSYDIPNYFNEVYTSGYGAKYVPSTYPSGPFLATDYVRLPQFSQTGIMICNSNANTRAGYTTTNGVITETGIHTAANTNSKYNQHVYTIDQPFDLRVINPTEKIIYNPSEVEIDLSGNSQGTTLTFPSGYTFKTVLGNYPSELEYAQDDPNGYYASNPFNAPIENNANTGGYTSKYIVKSGTTLEIEDCVTIIDAEIEVMANGTLNYNSNTLYGNYTITGLGTINNNSAVLSCDQECLNNTITTNDWNNYTVTSNETLTMNTTKRVFGVLTVASGNTLVLEEGVRLEFAPSAKIIIAPNGSLITNGTAANEVEITSMCENMWEGIELRGTGTSNEAYVNLNHTLLENAKTGIQTYHSFKASNYYGYVSVNNTTILNCITGMDIKTPILSSCCSSSNQFFNCDFITTNDIPDDRFGIYNIYRPQITHVKVSGVRNKISFESCVFENQNSNLEEHEKGIGIDVTDAWLKLGLNQSVDVNQFTNLTTGIVLRDELTYSFTQIDDAVFTNNIYGIVLVNRDFVDIHNCQFTVPESATIAAGNLESNYDKYERPTGIYCSNSSGFYIYENSFTGVPTNSSNVNCNDCNQAVVVDGTTRNAQYPGNGLVLNNSFEDINMGVLAQNGNGITDRLGFPNPYIEGTGVSVVCNDFSNLTTYDFAITLETDVWLQPISSIRDQGYCLSDNNPSNDYPALNSFDFCANQTRQVHNESGDLTYFHATLNVPSCTLSTVLVECDYNFNLSTNAIKCNDYYANFDPVSIPLTEKRAQFKNKTEELKEKKYAFDQLLDGGHSVQLLDVVENGSIAEAVSELTAVGSYVSDEVLVAAIDRLGTVENEKLLTILQNNAKLSATVWSAVTAYDDEFNTSLAEALAWYQEGVSARESYVKWIDHIAFERNTILDGLYFMDMMENEQLTVTLDVLREEDDLQLKAKLVPMLLMEQEYEEAESVWTELNTTMAGNLYSLEQEVLLRMNRDQIDFYELPANLISQLSQYWIDEPQASAKSALLAGLRKWTYFVEPGLLNVSNENNKWSGASNDAPKESDPQEILICFPNPTNGLGTIKGFVNNVTDTELVIYNSIGQLMDRIPVVQNQFEFPTQFPATGLYLISLETKGEVIQQQKWIVQ